MPSYEKVTQRAGSRQSMTGLTAEEFRALLPHFEHALATTIGRLGWRVYATNTPSDQLSLPQAVRAYRSQYLVESDMGRLKGRPLSLTPMYLARDDHATGLIRLWSIGLRVLTLPEFVVRQRYHLTPVSCVQQSILAILDFPVDIYTRLCRNSRKPP
jgi:transposase